MLEFAILVLLLIGPGFPGDRRQDMASDLRELIPFDAARN